MPTDQFSSTKKIISNNITSVGYNDCRHASQTRSLQEVSNKCERLDKYGTIASAICAVHCFLTSVAFGMLSFFGLGFLGNPITDVFFVIIAITLGTFAVKNGYKHHQNKIPALLFVLGLTMVFISHFVLGHEHGHDHLHPEHLHSEIQEVLTSILAVVGGLTIMSFHIVNARLQRKARKRLQCCRGH